MAGAKSLTDLAALIQRDVVAINDDLTAANAPQPSFQVGSPPLMLSPQGEETRQQLLEALDELRALILGPVGPIVRATLPIVRPSLSPAPCP